MEHDSLSVTRRLTIWGLASLGVVLILWLGYFILQDSPGYCRGAPTAYGQLHTVAADRRTAVFRRLTLAGRIGVYQADQRCGRPSQLSLSDLIADRDSGAVPELVTTLGELRTAADTSVVVQMLAYVKCVRGFTVQIDSGIVTSVTVALARMPDGRTRSDGVAALNRVAGQCRLYP